MDTEPGGERLDTEPGGERLDTVSRTRFWSPRTWSLRVRLLVIQVLLLAVVCTGIGVATEFALKRFLSHQLDDQLLEAGRRSAAIYDMPPPPFAGALRLPSPRVGPRSPEFPEPSPGLPALPPGFSYRERLDPELGPGPAFLERFVLKLPIGIEREVRLKPVHIFCDFIFLWIHIRGIRND